MCAQKLFALSAAAVVTEHGPIDPPKDVSEMPRGALPTARALSGTASTVQVSRPASMHSTTRRPRARTRSLPERRYFGRASTRSSRTTALRNGQHCRFNDTAPFLKWCVRAQAPAAAAMRTRVCVRSLQGADAARVLPGLGSGVRAPAKGKLAAITGVPATVRAHAHRLRLCEINFLCVHKRLRAKRLAPVLIKEVTAGGVNLQASSQGASEDARGEAVQARRVPGGEEGRRGREMQQQRSPAHAHAHPHAPPHTHSLQAAYTAGVVLPKPVSSCKYWHRTIDPKKLIEDQGFTRPPRSRGMREGADLRCLPRSARSPPFSLHARVRSRAGPLARSVRNDALPGARAHARRAPPGAARHPCDLRAAERLPREARRGPRTCSHCPASHCLAPAARPAAGLRSRRTSLRRSARTRCCRGRASSTRS